MSNPLPWSVRSCANHPERTDLPCYRVRDANGEIVLGHVILERVTKLEEALQKIASCVPVFDGDVISIARAVLVHPDELCPPVNQGTNEAQ